MSGYQIRQNILAEAKDILFRDWEHRCNVENETATLYKKAPRAIPCPTHQEILELAGTLYDFVENGSRVPSRVPFEAKVSPGKTGMGGRVVATRKGSFDWKQEKKILKETEATLEADDCSDDTDSKESALLSAVLDSVTDLTVGELKAVGQKVVEMLEKVHLSQGQKP